MTAIQYLHHVPGRLRVKGRRLSCEGAHARQAMAMLRAMEGVQSVDLNTRAGSLTVNYDPALRTQTELLGAMEQAGCLKVASATVRAGSAPRSPARSEGVLDAFGKALVGALAQRTATRLIGALL
jgi:copper chaperone CopZ